MSCIHCANKTRDAAKEYPCLCDQFVHPLPLHIDTGLNKLPRQIATFPEFRRAMLRAVKTEQVEIIDSNNILVKISPLAEWRARDKDDFGIMLLEMWAYICDSLSFYDEVIANETYIRTSFLRPNLRRLVDLLGYLPRPTVGSLVELAVMAEGRLQIKLPAGTAFRSTSFDGNPPQVFELDDDRFIHPFTNKFGIRAPHKGTIGNTFPDSLLVNPASQLNEDALLFLIHKTDNSQSGAVRVKKLEKYNGADNKQYTRLSFTSSTNLQAGTLLSDIRLLNPTLTGGLWTTSETNKSINGNKITLHTVSHQVKPGDAIILTYQDETRWYKIKDVIDEMRSAIPSSTITINGSNFTVPGVVVPATVLALDVDINSPDRMQPWAPAWIPAICAGVTVYYGMQLAAAIIDEPNSTLSATDPVDISTIVETPIEKYDPVRFLVLDKNTRGAGFGGNLLYDQKKIIVDPVNDWKEPMTLPVDVYGNVLKASRGEKVENEKMGSGDASVASQTFKLKKKPLTYHLSPTVDNDAGVKSTLTVYVNGIKWLEVNSFFGKNENDQVYIVRQNDDGDSSVIFGDGIRGQRLPSGTDNIIGNYRFGAEKPCPPANSITQISKPVKGLQSVKNMLAAFGGDDAEKEESLRTNAPKSALILGRVVSMKDMEALTAGFPGVRAVQTEWRWDTIKQRATAHIFYVGDTSLRASISKRLRSFADPSTPITLETTIPDPLFLSLDVKINPRYNEENVLRELRSLLTGVPNGFLAPENIGIGLPLYRSKIFERVLEVEGTESVTGIFTGTEVFSAFAIMPGTGAGYYFDIEQGKLIINGKEN